MITPSGVTKSSPDSSPQFDLGIPEWEFDLGEQKLGGGMLYEEEDEEDSMDWSMNGGKVVLGAAGVAMSPRALRGGCCSCGHGDDGLGLGLYVIDEEEEPRSGQA